MRVLLPCGPDGIRDVFCAPTTGDSGSRRRPGGERLSLGTAGDARSPGEVKSASSGSATLSVSGVRIRLTWS